MLKGLIFDNSAGLKAVETAPGIFTIQATAGGTPGAHAATHKSGGSDQVKLDELAAPTDITTLNASASAHGLLPKLDGSASKYLDGSGAWSTPAGGGSSLYSPDTVPSSPNTEDDEFAAGSLNAKWTLTTVGSMTTVYNSPSSHVKITNGGGTTDDWRITQNYAPGAGVAFSLTCKVRGNFKAQSHAAVMHVQDSGGNEQSRVFMYWDNPGTARLAVGGDHRDGGSYVGGATITTPILADKMYLRMERNTSNVWKILASMDGVLYVEILTFSKTFTVAKIVLWCASQGTAGNWQCAFDWIRRDWTP